MLAAVRRGNAVEPRIQYAQTSDGVSIAFWTLGEGRPLVHLPNIPFSHVQLEWQLPGWRRWYERLAERSMLVRYDTRGSGLSDREVTDFSLDALVLDLEGLVNSLQLEQFSLLAPLFSGPVAIAYAARRPERVSHLILWCSYARGSEYYRSPQVQALRALRDKDWETYTETVAHSFLGWSAGDEAHQFAVYMQECSTPDAVQSVWNAQTEHDVVALLPQVRSPTLVMHRRQLPVLDVAVARGLASRIPNARLLLLEGASAAPWVDTEAVATAIDDFSGEGEEAAAAHRTLPKEDVHTILFTDMEGSTTLTERLGDAKAQELRRTHDGIVRDALKAQGGSETKHTGDGIMASFPSASRAIECAVAVQKAIADGETPLRVRIGLNAGEPVAEESDLFGTAVNLAKRICDQAEPGQILVSDVVQQLAAGKGFTFTDKGEAALKGFEKPVRLHEVVWG
jgi:class 3 adenylate cyclase